MPEVSIIIVNFNRAADVAACVASVRTHVREASYEIVVVDNASTTEDRGRLRTIEGIRVIPESENRGFGGGNNSGADAARGDFLFFLNPDALLTNDAVSSFLRFATGPGAYKVGAIGCILTDHAGRPAHSYGDFAPKRISSFAMSQITGTLRRILKRRRARRPASERELVEYPLRVDWITGAALFMPRSAFMEVGGFDERIFLYSEEVDLQKRLRVKGYGRVIIDGPGIIHSHDGRESSGTRQHYYRGLLTFLALHNPCWEVALAFWILKACLAVNGLLDWMEGSRSIAEEAKLLRGIRLADIYRRIATVAPRRCGSDAA